MTGPKMQGEYTYEDGHLHITTDSGQSVDLCGESADRMAETIDASEEHGEFTMDEQAWYNSARGSFR